MSSAFTNSLDPDNRRKYPMYLSNETDEIVGNHQVISFNKVKEWVGKNGGFRPGGGGGGVHVVKFIVGLRQHCKNTSGRIMSTLQKKTWGGGGCPSVQKSAGGCLGGYCLTLVVAHLLLS